MLIFISGGVRSGKSALGEKLLVNHTGRKVYLATAEAYDEEMTERIIRHQSDRASKGFMTIERNRDVGSAAEELQRGDTVLLDCLGNLAANEMFAGAYVQSGTDTVDAIASKVYDGIMAVSSAVSTLIVVSNEVFSDGNRYEQMTLNYIELLGKLHCRLAARADAAIECVSGNYIVHKGKQMIHLPSPVY